METLPEQQHARARHARDLEFAGRVVARDPLALEQLNERLACLPAMVRFQNQRLGLPLDALDLEEVVRETTLALWAKLPTFEGRSTLETWAFRFAMLELLKAMQARARRPDHLETPEESPDTRAEEITESLPYEAAELHSGLEELSAEAATVIRMRHWEELPFERIVERTGLPLNTVKARYYRGLARLKEILERHQREDSMTHDARTAADAELFEALLQGRVAEGDAELGNLFERRPQWRELFERARSDAGASPEFAGASEADRRLVAECLAEARAPRPQVTRIARRSTLPQLLLLVAALALICLGYAWWRSERGPVRPVGELLGSGGALDFFQAGRAAADYGAFEWTCKPLPRGERFLFTIWAEDTGGARGPQLGPALETFTPRVEIPLETRRSWPEAVIWRVACVDTSGTSSAWHEWRAQRDKH